MPNDIAEMLIRTVSIRLDVEKIITRELIDDFIAQQCLHPYFSLTTDEKEYASKALLAQYTVWMSQEPTVLSDNTDHIEWLSDCRKDIDFAFWERYQEFLRREGIPKNVLIDLDRTSDIILSYMENPKREGDWDRRGMVVGEVQSGKTSNYIGLICKAADAGFKTIIVLAGLHNSLRSQTQIRIDAGFCGRDSRNDQMLVGAGLLKGFKVKGHDSLTSSAEDGDFKISTARNVFLNLGGNPLILVVKKNASVLKNLINWLKYQIKTNSASSKINDIPFLLIDDEADNASVNGKAVKRDEFGKELKEEDPAKINKQIRTILNLFQKSAYVGYTATPFANIFIYPKSSNLKDWGEDLFPRSFMVNLPTPSNYIGPSKLFGLNCDKFSAEPLPIIRIINDYTDFIPDKHKSDHSVTAEIPASLEQAIKSFIISCAVRIIRGQGNKHNSMLIHITRYVDVQKQVVNKVDERIRYIRNCLKYNSSAESHNVLHSFEILWSDYKTTTKMINSNSTEKYELPQWNKVKDALYDAVSKIEVKEINGSAKDALDYKGREQHGMYVIAVGGDKLSRGLTLEGLTVSYYLRASKMYDTLMQMGRWFGYRPGYLDLCRLYTSPELVEWYRYIALASQELREEFDYMNSIDATPADFGLRVRNHTGVLQITATNKLRNGTKMKVSFKNSLCSTVHFHESIKNIDHNLNCLNSLISTLGDPTIKNRQYCWEGVKAENVVSFLRSYKAHLLNTKAEPGRLSEYIESQLNNNELSGWSIFLISKTQDTVTPYKMGGLPVGLIKRSRSDRSGDDRYSLISGQLITEDHEFLDLSESEYDEAKVNYFKNSPENTKRETPSGYYVRRARPSQRGLLLLYLIESSINEKPFVGYAISFPDSSNAAELEYTVNTTYWSKLYDED